MEQQVDNNFVLWWHFPQIQRKNEPTFTSPVQWGRERYHPSLKLRSWVVSSCWLRLRLASGRTTRRDLLLQIRQIQVLFGQIYFTSKTNTHCNLDKFDKTQLVHICIIVRQSESYPRLGLVYYCSCWIKFSLKKIDPAIFVPIILQEPFKRCDVCILTKEIPSACNKTFTARKVWQNGNRNKSIGNTFKQIHIEI